MVRKGLASKVSFSNKLLVKVKRDWRELQVEPLALEFLSDPLNRVTAYFFAERSKLARQVRLRRPAVHRNQLLGGLLLHLQRLRFEPLRRLRCQMQQRGRNFGKLCPSLRSKKPAEIHCQVINWVVD